MPKSFRKQDRPASYKAADNLSKHQQQLLAIIVEFMQGAQPHNVLHSLNNHLYNFTTTEIFTPAQAE